MSESIESEKKCLYDKLSDKFKGFSLFYEVIEGKITIPIEVLTFIKHDKNHGYEGFSLDLLRRISKISDIRGKINLCSLETGDTNYKKVLQIKKATNSIIALNLSLEQLDDMFKILESIPVTKSQVSSNIQDVDGTIESSINRNGIYDNIPHIKR